ncbi:MAG TPA: copper resistance protein [Casimicrobiaceae bacterium]|nr:copper resistance protein [Casimicrobiaceae bacterium]
MINVLLQDPSTGSAIRSDRIVLDRRSVPAGKVTFRAINQSKELVHEMLVVPAKPRQPLPYDQTKAEVVESRIKVLGDLDDLRPGASGTITVDLKPGFYIVLCNQPGHYKAGMQTKLFVTK